MSEVASEENERWTWRERVMLGATLAFVLLPVMLYTSTGPRRAGLLTATAVFCLLFLTRLPRPSMSDFQRRGWRVMVGAILVAHLASFVGGWGEGNGLYLPARDLALGLAGLVGVLGLAWFWSRPMCRRVGLGLSAGLLTFLLAGSLGGYFLSIERLMEMGGDPVHFSPTRLQLLWLGRLLTTGWGQLVWEHANIAGLWFGIGFALLAERLAARPAAAGWWLLAGGCLMAVFLTGSRSAWLIVLFALPLVLIGRPWRRAARIGLLVAVAVAAGLAALDLKIRLNEQAARGEAAEETAGTGGLRADELHVGGLVSRGSSGRIAGYEILWRQLEGRRVFGRGLDATNRPLVHLTHEHSIYLGSLRGGGFVALAAHLAILATAALFAAARFRRGERWPAVFLVAVAVGLLFDRVNVFKFSGHHEFLLHWLAVFLPLLPRPRDERPPARFRATP